MQLNFHILLTGKRNTTIEVITPKIYKAELWFLFMKHCLIVLYNCMKFRLNSFNGCQVNTERTRNSIANDQREITPKIYKGELWFLCMTHRLIVLYNCMKFHLNSFNGCQLTERTRNSIANDKREITPKISKAELWFLCMTYCLIVLYNCMKIHFNSFNGCQLTEQTRNSIANDQQEITPKISKAELCILCMTHCLIVRYKCMKFQPNSFNSVQLTERIRNCIYLRYKGDNLKNIYARVMVLVHDMSSQCAYKCMKFR